ELVLRAPASPHDDDVDLLDLLERAQRTTHRLRGPEPLHLRGREQDARAAAAERDLTDVVDDGAAPARDDADDARILRDRPLLRLGEEPLGGELLLQPLERLEERALA